MINISIKKMKPSDHRNMYEFWMRIEGIGLSSVDTKKELKKYLKKNPGMSFIARVEGYIVGTILAGHDGRRGYIYHFAVDGEFRNKKLGKTLLTTVIRKLRDAGIQKCHTMVFKNNVTGKEIWKKFGWTLREDLDVMSKEINSL